MKIAITGSTGLIGTVLVDWFTKHNHQVSRLVRSTNFPDHRFKNILWDPKEKKIDAHALEGHDVVIHLAGENIAAGRWTDEKKKSIRDSRVQGTALLSETLSKLSQPPKLLLSASAFGFYGSNDRRGLLSEPDLERMDESSPPGTGFLSSVTHEWEKMTQAAEQSGIRVVHLRTGIVLSTKGGALQRMLLPFKLGMGGRIGSGHQMMSWISIEEFPRIVHHLINHPEISGPVNLTAPNPVSNAEFAKTLGRVLRRPTIFPLPAGVAKTLLGEMAEELLLSGRAVVPKKLLAAGYSFLYPNLEEALRHLLSQPH